MTKKIFKLARKQNFNSLNSLALVFLQFASALLKFKRCLVIKKSSRQQKQQQFNFLCSGKLDLFSNIPILLLQVENRVIIKNPK